jgi:peptide-methionine (S)-S-oxide reductase
MKSLRFISVLAALATLIVAPAQSQARLATAVFAGGCFWTMEYKFEHVAGVTSAVSGYSGGQEKNPTYNQVAGHKTHHLEVVKVTYDPAKISYRGLVDHYWRMIDPTDSEGQVCDLAPNYLTAIFVANPQEKAVAQASMAAINDGPRKGRIATTIRDAMPFYPAEAEHQDYARRNPGDYEAYRVGCGRDRVLARIWADKAPLG